MDMGGEEPATDELDLDMDMDMGGEDQMPDEGGVDGIKIIQKLTGKLGQKLRTMDQRQGLSSEDIKYVLNSIISAVDLAKLSEEDREDVLSKFESDDIIDYGVDDEAELDIDAGEDELDFDLDMNMGDDESDETETEMSEQGMDEMLKMVDEIFTESKVDKVLNRYFKETNVEKTINEEKKIKNFLNEKIKNVSIRKEVKKLSESIEQELASEFLIKENNNINFLGKTNLKNLLFVSDGVKYKVTTKGEIV